MADFLNTYLFHWHPSKAIWIGGHSLSWDARCAGIYIGFGIGVLYHLAVDKKAKNLPSRSILFVNTLLCALLFLDVFTIKYGFRQPSNDIRYLTGLLFGTAFSVYLYPAFITLVYSKGHDSTAVNSLRRFAVFLVLISGAFFIKTYDSFFVYAALETLAYFGFLSLFTILIFGASKALRLLVLPAKNIN